MTAPTEQNEGELHFGVTHVPVGFTTTQTSQFDGSAEPVVRELVQNCLDAANNADRFAEVKFIVDEVPYSEIPGWEEYRQAFEEAKQQRQQRQTKSKMKVSQDEKMIIKRMDSKIGRLSIPVLVCVDNGCGITQQRMISLLSVGNTDKGDGGVGSFGLGHHAAFSASDLRYVLYGSRYSANRSNGTIASGHAILATRKHDSKILAGEGYWRKTGWSGEPWVDGSEFPTTIPHILENYLPTKDTGTVVGIIGFNDFRRNNNDPTVDEQITQVIAANFCVAIDDGLLTVTIKTGNSSKQITIDKYMLESTLEKNSNRIQADKHGYISGSQAYSAWYTLQNGYRLPLDDIDGMEGVEVRWRHIGTDHKESTQVHLYRKGMWISSRVKYLKKADFASTRPFDAVIKLTDGSLEKLIRWSEGPEHRGVDTKRLDSEQQQELRELFKVLRNKLQEEVGDISEENSYIPESFAILCGENTLKAEPLHKVYEIELDGDNKDANVEEESENDAVAKSIGEEEHMLRKLKPGKRADYQYVLQASTHAKMIEVVLRYKENTNDNHNMGIRLSRASGADATCSSPPRDDYLYLKSVIASVKDSGDAESNAIDHNGDLEIELPAMSNGDRTLIIEIAGKDAQRIADSPHLLTLDIVKRAHKNTDKLESELDQESDE